MNRLRIVLAIILAFMMFAVLMGSVGTVILQSIQSFGVSKAQAATLEGFKDIPVMLVSFFLASLLPRLGYRRAMMIGLGLVAVGCLAMPLLDSFWMTRMLFAITGGAFGLVKVAVYSSIGLLTADRREHAALTNIIEGCYMLGMLGGYWLFGAFIDPAEPGNLAWMQVYWVLAAMCLALVVLLAGSRLDESAAHGPPQSVSESFADMLRLALRPVVLVFVLSALLYVLIEQSLGTWLPTFNREILRLPAAMSVQMASIFAASLGVGRLAAGVLLRRLPWYGVLNLCVVAMGLLVVLTLPLTHGIQDGPVAGWADAPLAAWVFPLIGLFMAPIYPAINSVMLSALPKPQHAAMTGLLVIASALGGTSGSMVTGLVFDALGGQTAFYLSLLPMSAILLTLFLFRRETEKLARAVV